jgi:hypothetical protein
MAELIALNCGAAGGKRPRQATREPSRKARE